MVRKAARDAVRAAIQGEPEFSDITLLRSWGTSIDADQLPVIAVVTPIEQTRRLSTDTVARVTTVEIGLRRAGADDLEDVLDADADALERLALPVLMAIAPDAELTGTRFDVNGEGGKRIGTLVLEFSMPRRTMVGAPS